MSVQNNNEINVSDVKVRPIKSKKQFKLIIFGAVVFLLLLSFATHALLFSNKSSNFNLLNNSLSTSSNSSKTSASSAISNSTNATISSNIATSASSVLDPSSPVKSYRGTIGTLPIRMVLNLDEAVTIYSNYNGSLIYEGISDKVLSLKGYFLNNTKPECKSYCEFYFDEMDGAVVTGKLSGTIDPQYNLTGVWTKPDGSGKLDLKLKLTNNFNISDYLKKGNYSGFKYDVNALSSGILADCFEYEDNQKLGTKVISEVYSSKLNKKYVTISGTGTLCAGNINTPWILYQIESGGKATKITEEEVSNGGVIYMSPDETKLIVTRGSHGGYCSDINGFSVVDLNTNKQVAIVYPDSKNTSSLWVAGDITWVNSQTITYRNLIMSEAECAEVADFEKIWPKQEVKTVKI